MAFYISTDDQDLIQFTKACAQRCGSTVFEEESIFSAAKNASSEKSEDILFLTCEQFLSLASAKATFPNLNWHRIHSIIDPDNSKALASVVGTGLAKNLVLRRLENSAECGMNYALHLYPSLDRVFQSFPSYETTEFSEPKDKQVILQNFELGLHDLSISPRVTNSVACALEELMLIALRRGTDVSSPGQPQPISLRLALSPELIIAQVDWTLEPDRQRTLSECFNLSVKTVGETAPYTTDNAISFKLIIQSGASLRIKNRRDGQMQALMTFKPSGSLLDSRHQFQYFSNLIEVS